MSTRNAREKITDNFYVDEFECKCGECDMIEMDGLFMLRLQGVRDELGKPMQVTSGYRCIKHNKSVGGKLGSYHTKGKAADIWVRDSNIRWHLVKIALRYGFGGVGIGKDYVHLDIRRKPSLWHYYRKKA